MAACAVSPAPVAPTVSSISPNVAAAAGGTAVTISGTGFNSASTVEFGERRASTVRVLSTTSIAAISPPGAGTVAVRVLGADGVSAEVAPDTLAYDPPPSGPWLGLNGNSVSHFGPIDRFEQGHVVFDRVELFAGELPTTHDLLHRAIDHNMIPDVVIEYDGYTGNNWGRLDKHFPRGDGIAAYVNGFVRTVTAIRRMYPHTRIIFEPINEPYGYATAAQYAAVIVSLLPAAQSAGVPVKDIYVAGWGRGWIPGMYAAQPALKSMIEGWYLHPYGLPTGAQNEYGVGISSVPYVQAQMTSGQNNIVISEIGFCALRVNRGGDCAYPNVKTGREAAAMLASTLQEALPMRRAGWLRALIVYARSDGGWAMQLPDGQLTEQGRELLRFAHAHPEE